MLSTSRLSRRPSSIRYRQPPVEHGISTEGPGYASVARSGGRRNPKCSPGRWLSCAGHPASEILGTQAMFNVLQGKYNTVTSEFADLMLAITGRLQGQKTKKSCARQRSARTRPRSPAVRLTCWSHHGKTGEPRHQRPAVTAATKMC